MIVMLMVAFHNSDIIGGSNDNSLHNQNMAADGNDGNGGNRGNGGDGGM